MSILKKVRPQVEQLMDRILPATAIFSNGQLFVQGDNLGDKLNVSADAAGVLHVTQRNQEVTIQNGQATLTNTRVVVERSGAGRGNTLATDASLGTIPTVLDATRGRDNTVTPGNSGPSTMMGGKGFNSLVSGPGPDVILGGTDRFSVNLFDWEPGTGTDTFIGQAGLNVMLVVGNNNARGENDQVDADGLGGFIYTRNNVVPFKIFASGMNVLVIRPSDGDDTVTINDLTGVQGLRAIEVDGLNGTDTVDFSAQRNAQIAAIFDGGAGADTFTTGAGRNVVQNRDAQDTIIIAPNSGPLGRRYGLGGRWSLLASSLNDYVNL